MCVPRFTSWVIVVASHVPPQAAQRWVLDGVMVFFSVAARVFPLARVEPVHGNDIETLISCIESRRNIQRLVVVLHPHEQTLGERFCPRALLNNIPLDQDLFCLLPGNAAFLSPQEPVPLDQGGTT